MSSLVERPAGPGGYSATDLAAEMRTGRLTAVEVMEAILDRAAAVQPSINAFTWIDHEAALDEARAADLVLAEGGGGPLTGVPVAIKELTPVAGQPFTLGSVAFKDQVALVTDPGVQTLIDAGAIPFARTNSPEFGCASVTDNDLFGQTLNPWNPEYSAAGSSGGAAAALAAWATPLAQGTDSAGSLRMPAAACGVVGLKPTHGAVPVGAPSYLDNFGHSGPMARTVADARLMLDAMARVDTDHLYGTPLARGGGRDELRGLHVRVIDAMPGLDVDHEVAENLAFTVEMLERAGVTVHRQSFPWDFERLFDAVRQAFAATYMPLARLARDSGGTITDLTEAFIADVAPAAADGLQTVRAQAAMAELHADMACLLSDVEVLMLPTLAMPAPVANDRFIDHAPMVNGREHEDRWVVAFTVPFNLTSQCPAVSLPSGQSRAGVPLAVQIVGRPREDFSLLDIAQLVEVEVARSGAGLVA